MPGSYFGKETKAFLDEVKSTEGAITAEVVGKNLIEKTILLGRRTAEMHKALISTKDDPNFETEWFSLHYQSSIYAGLYSIGEEQFRNP